jgi:hypothetical protein
MTRTICTTSRTPRVSVRAAPTTPCRGGLRDRLREFGIKRGPQRSSPTRSTASRVGAKNNLDNRVKIASSIYYIRWNNIQQTVVPPICQISFIDNLGKAVAKGADIQGEIAITDTSRRRSRPATPTPATPGSVLSAGGDLNRRRQGRCHRRPKRSTRAAVHGVDRARIQVHVVHARYLRARR